MDLKGNMEDYVKEQYLCGDPVRIYKARNIKENNSLYAIKEFTYTEADLPNIEREIDIMYQLKSHPNIISIKEDHKTTGKYGEKFMNIILELADMDVHKMILDKFSKGGRFTPEELMSLGGEVGEALRYAHSKNIAHRDIKAPNVLVVNGVYKLADYGISKTKDPKQSAYHTRQGTREYVAPEVIYSGRYTKSVDVWSLGILLYFAATKQYPFPNFGSVPQHQLTDMLNNHKYNKEILRRDYPQLLFIIDKMLEPDPAKRISLELFLRYIIQEPVEDIQHSSLIIKTNDRHFYDQYPYGRFILEDNGSTLRSIMISYIEQIIIMGTTSIKKLKDLIHKGEKFYKLEGDRPQLYRELLCINLEEILEYAKNNKNPLKYFHKLLQCSFQFDKSLIQLAISMISNIIKVYPITNLQNIPIDINEQAILLLPTILSIPITLIQITNENELQSHIYQDKLFTVQSTDYIQIDDAYITLYKDESKIAILYPTYSQIFESISERKKKCIYEQAYKFESNSDIYSAKRDSLLRKEDINIKSKKLMEKGQIGDQYRYFDQNEKTSIRSIQDLKIQSAIPVDTDLQYMISPPKFEEIRRYYGLIRKIKRDDGNSFYRAAMFVFIEKLIIYGTNYVHLFRDLIVKGESFFYLTEEPPELRTTLLGYLEQIEKEYLLETEPELKVKNAHFLFVKMVLLDNYFDYALIRLLRRMVATFIEFNFDIQIEGICLQDMLQMNHMEFIQQNVLAEGVEASYVVIRLIPILLRINVVIVDTREGTQTFSHQNSKIENLNNITGTEIDLHDLNFGLLIDQTGFDVIYENEVFDQIMNIQQFENSFFTQITPQLGIPVNDPTLSHPNKFTPVMNQERSETTNYSQPINPPSPNPVGNLNEENIINSKDETNKGRIEINTSTRPQIGAGAAEINAYNHPDRPVDAREMVNEGPPIEYTICCNKQFVLDNYKNLILNSCPLNYMYALQNGNILYPNCPFCQILLCPQMLRCIFEQSKINELELRYRESVQIREKLCTDCKLVIAEGEIDKDYYILSKCNHKFHADCIIGLYKQAPSIKCPAANCEHELTKEECKKMEKRIPKFNKNKKVLSKTQKKRKEKRAKALAANKSSKVDPETYTVDNRPQSTGLGIDKGERNEIYKEPQTAPPIQHELQFKEPIGRKSGDREQEVKLAKAASTHEGMPSIADEGNIQSPILSRIKQSANAGGVNNHHLGGYEKLISFESTITTTCCATKFATVTYRNLILSNCKLDRMYALTEDGSIIYPTCPKCNGRILPLALRSILEDPLIAKLEERRLNSERIRTTMKAKCPICNFNTDHGANYINFFRFSECLHTFHPKCIFPIYRDTNMSLEMTCPALNCQHILTPYEIKELKEEIDRQTIEESKEEENIVGTCEICAKRILGKSEFIELTNCKHKLHYSCIKKSTKMIKICPNRFCKIKRNEDDYYLIEEIRMAVNQGGGYRTNLSPIIKPVFDPNRLCLFCHKPYEKRRNYVLLSCSHAFHKNCLSNYKGLSKDITRCPDCNGILSKTDETIIQKLEVKNVKRLESKEPVCTHLISNICCMCKNNILNGDEFVLRTCKHKYHQRCIRDLLKFNRNQENNPICPVCSAQIDLDDLQLLQLMNQRQIPISKVDEERKEYQAQSICEVCKKFAYLKVLIPLGCGHRLHSECIATLIGEQTGQRYLLTPREKLDYKLVCPVQHCGHDISYINVRDYLDPEVYKYIEGLYLERMKKNIELDKKVIKISKEGEKHTLKCCEQEYDLEGLKHQIHSYLDEGFPLILGTKELPFQWMNCVLCNAVMKLPDLFTLLTMEFLTKYAENVCCICGQKNTLIVGKNCDTHRICSTCHTQHMDKTVPCKICPLFGKKNRGIPIIDKPIKIKFPENMNKDIVKMFNIFTNKSKTCLDKLKLYSCAICGATLTFLNSIPLEICGHYVCFKHEKLTYGINCRRCKENRTPINKFCKCKEKTIKNNYYVRDVRNFFKSNIVNNIKKETTLSTRCPICSDCILPHKLLNIFPDSLISEIKRHKKNNRPIFPLDVFEEYYLKCIN